MFLRKALTLVGVLYASSSVMAAEWNTEPSVSLRGHYNDNVGMRSVDEQSSSGYTLEPRLKLKGEELNLWKVSLDTRLRRIQYPSVENADSNNVFFDLSGGYQTERSYWNMGTYFERNTTLDTDFDTESINSSLLSDHTEREKVSITPSVNWRTAETTLISLRLNTADIDYDEITDTRYVDYETNEVSFSSTWEITKNSNLGFTLVFADYESEDANFEYDQQIAQLDYKYQISEATDVSFAIGQRRIDSTAFDAQVVGCNTGTLVDANGDGIDDACLIGFFLVPDDRILGDLQGDDKGAVVSLSYTARSETSSNSISAGRTVMPSSFGGAQEEQRITYQYSNNVSERLNAKLILDAFETETISGVDNSNDRKRYRIEPSIRWKLTSNWNLSFSYRYIDQNLTSTDENSKSNAIYINLFLNWPKLVSSY
ncbi:MAG: hypothetical protein OQL06_11710 [Gammaproteobacteria bacterium]|nr:hypothetical protein [Gammaproteobacteria bacterium]